MAEYIEFPCVKYRITQWFGKNPNIYRKFGLKGHNGIDFADGNHKNYFFSSGKVIKCKNDFGYGNMIRIVTDNGWEETYGHFAEIPPFNVGDKVKQFQYAGPMGTTGFSTGIHLHYGRRPADYHNINNGYKGYVDPKPYLIKITKDYMEKLEALEKELNTVKSDVNDLKQKKAKLKPIYKQANKYKKGKLFYPVGKVYKQLKVAKIQPFRKWLNVQNAIEDKAIKKREINK